MVQPALILPPERNERWDLARQMGVEQAVINTMNIGDGHRYSGYDELLLLTNRFENAGLDLTVIEESFPLTNTTILAKDGRDAEIQKFCDFLRNAGGVGIDVVCYDWMVSRWTRTDVTVPSRGGSLTTAYNHKQMQQGPDHPEAPVTEEELWESLEYFLEKAVPVAEEADVNLALHPNDPPLSSIRGVERIFTSVEDFERMLDLVPSEQNGITFCQGNFSAMGVDIPDTIERFGDAIKYIHFRDVTGTAENFDEVWHDQGPTDMDEAIKSYQNISYDGPARPDHVPTMAGEANDKPGYESKGRLFAVGYMNGLIDANKS